MNILLNEILNLSADAGGGNYIITGVDGLGSAEIRTSSFLFSGRNGGLITDQHLGFRMISISGKIGSITSTRLQHQQDRDAMIAALPIGETIPVRITTFSGQTYLIECNVTDRKVEYNQRGYMSDFLIQLTAGDPLFYNTDGGDEQSVILNRIIDNGGYVTPYILPVEWDAGGAPTNITNNGNAYYYPVITLTGTALNPTITNLTTGESFELELTMVDGDEIIIDMYNRTVTLDGSDIIGNKSDASIWWALVPGVNTLELDTDTSSDDVQAEIVWRNGVTGI